MFKVNTTSVITAHKSISKRFRSIKDLFPVYDEYLASYNKITTNTKQQPEEVISMINMVYREMNRIKKDTEMLLYYYKSGDLLYEYEIMDPFNTRKKFKEMTPHMKTCSKTQKQNSKIIF